MGLETVVVHILPWQVTTQGGGFKVQTGELHCINL